MVKIRRGWYLVDIKTDEDDRKIKEKEAALETRRASVIKRCDKKITRRSRAEQREAILSEKLSHVAVDTKQEEIELTHRLAAELSRRKDEEIKGALKSGRVKSFGRSPPSCALNKARPRLIEEKIRLEASQAEVLKLWYEDKTVKKLQQAEDERKKRNLRDELHSQLADDRRIEQRRTEEKKQDRKMMEQVIRKTQEEEAKMRKRKENNAILLKEEIAASLAAKNAWEKKYKEALKDEDKRIARIIAEKEARQMKEVSMKTKFHAAREAAIDNVAKKLLANVYKEKKKQKFADKLYREEQRSKIKESVRPISRKQCAETFKELAKQKAESKARDEASDAVFVRYLVEERKKDIEKQRENNNNNNARHARKIQYRKELKKTVTNNRVTYVMDILERQSEICVHDKNSNQLTVTNVKQSNDRNNNNKKRR